VRIARWESLVDELVALRFCLVLVWAPGAPSGRGRWIISSPAPWASAEPLAVLDGHLLASFARLARPCRMASSIVFCRRSRARRLMRGNASLVEGQGDHRLAPNTITSRPSGAFVAACQEASVCRPFQDAAARGREATWTGVGERRQHLA